jgi:hypothetical protein
MVAFADKFRRDVFVITGVSTHVRAYHAKKKVHSATFIDSPEWTFVDDLTTPVFDGAEGSASVACALQSPH